MTEKHLLESLCQAARHLHERNLLAAGDGNLSFRLPEGQQIAISPSGVPKARLKPENFSLVDLDGVVVSGKPSSELAMHLAIYQDCPEARVVIHAHPPITIAWTIARPDLQEIPCEALPEVILSAGSIPVVPYARPGSAQLAESLRPYLPGHRLLVLARHGAVCWGEDVEEAVCGLERVEHVAQILKSACQLGGITALPETEVAVLREIRAKLGRRIR